MTRNSDVLISTTHVLEGYEILKYIKPITSHIVIGTNFFSDFVASWTDFLGGQSTTYQKKLSESYQLALKEIKNNALQIGANGIIGMHIDLDEISGKGKSMFMITASGTAVVIKSKIAELISTQDHVKNVLIPRQEMSNFLRKKKIYNEIKNNTLVLSDELWEFITESRFHEIAEDIIKATIKAYTESDGESLLRKLKMYFSALPENEIKELLYKTYLDGNKFYITNLTLEIIKQSSIFDAAILTRELEQLDMQKKYRIFNLLTVPKEIYVKEDIQDFRNLIALVRDKFPIIVEYTKKKRLLSDKEDEVWICTCKSKNSIDNIYCQSCGLDNYGFKQGSIGPLEAIDYLEGCIELMEILE